MFFFHLVEVSLEFRNEFRRAFDLLPLGSKLVTLDLGVEVILHERRIAKARRDAMFFFANKKRFFFCLTRRVGTLSEYDFA